MPTCEYLCTSTFSFFTITLYVYLNLLFNMDSWHDRNYFDAIDSKSYLIDSKVFYSISLYVLLFISVYILFLYSYIRIHHIHKDSKGIFYVQVLDMVSVYPHAIADIFSHRIRCTEIPIHIVKALQMKISMRNAMSK